MNLSDFTILNLFLSFLFGTFGFGYFIYGKKQGKPVPLIVGIILMIYPYFVSDAALMSGIGVVLMVIPYFIRL